MRRERKWFSKLFCISLLLACMILPTHADMGPKPSVVIDFENVPGGTYYVTLLAPSSGYGPHRSIWKENDVGERVRDHTVGHSYQGDSPEYRIWKKFIAYEEQDPEGLYFWGEFQACSGTDTYKWGYYPPQEFKILMYFPETDSFIRGEELLSRYAFDSYFTADLTGLKLTPGGETTGLRAVKSYDYTWEVVSLAVRVVLTIAVELFVAWVFRLRANKQLRLILLVNIVTQLGLNLALNWYAYQNGPTFLILPYLMMELVVAAVEFLVYFAWLPGLENQSRLKRGSITGSYALTANVVSLVLGWLLVYVISGIF